MCLFSVVVVLVLSRYCKVRARLRAGASMRASMHKQRGAGVEFSLPTRMAWKGEGGGADKGVTCLWKGKEKIINPGG